MSTNTESIDALLRAKARRELEQETRKVIEGALQRLITRNGGKYRQIHLDHKDLKVIENKPDAEDEDRYVVKIHIQALIEILIADAMDVLGPEAEQAAVTDFLERVESLGNEIDELRGQVQSE